MEAMESDQDRCLKGGASRESNDHGLDELLVYQDVRDQVEDVMAVVDASLDRHEYHREYLSSGTAVDQVLVERSQVGVVQTFVGSVGGVVIE